MHILRVTTPVAFEMRDTVDRTISLHAVYAPPAHSHPTVGLSGYSSTEREKLSQQRTPTAKDR